MNTDSAHIFALYCENLTALLGTKTTGSSLTLSEPALVHRIIHVLRLHQGQNLILFDREKSILCALEAVQGKKALHVIINEIHPTKAFAPSITLLLPLLKKEAFETALYNAVELGASEIVVVTTEKSRTHYQGTHELERNTKIMVAAAEQAKHFAFPHLQAPIALESALATLPMPHTGIVCTPEGSPLLTVLNTIKQTTDHLVLTMGPEGDFTKHEYELLAQHHFIPCALTPTILRSPQALAVALGALRSCIHAL